MNKFLYVLLILGGFAVLYGVGRTWKLRPETKYNHQLHAGETAVAARPAGGDVWFATNEGDCYEVTVAMSKPDNSYLEAAEASHAAFAVKAGTLVKVLGESESRVHVEIAEGAAAGKRGWVEFEYVRPRRAGEFR